MRQHLDPWTHVQVPAAEGRQPRSTCSHSRLTERWSLHTADEYRAKRTSAPRMVIVDTVQRKIVRLRPRQGAPVRRTTG
ncbi:hypothetical protein PsYK624_088220 [Phanerochaete sordida]|uniref:Uncharacterized protein n=1 Tax=Phanerochaete sordida TaxID=48140 RepID=A0A9P3LG35_9APHY|nr:hypothetical protein PsYK624_088220 [Phanerochaete sordida]